MCKYTQDKKEVSISIDKKVYLEVRTEFVEYIVPRRARLIFY